MKKKKKDSYFIQYSKLSSLHYFRHFFKSLKYKLNKQNKSFVVKRSD